MAPVCLAQKGTPLSCSAASVPLESEATMSSKSSTCLGVNSRSAQSTHLTLLAFDRPPDLSQSRHVARLESSKCRSDDSKHIYICASILAVLQDSCTSRLERLRRLSTPVALFDIVCCSPQCLVTKSHQCDMLLATL